MDKGKKREIEQRVADEAEMVFEEVPDPSQELSREERQRIRRTQKVLSKRVIDLKFADRLGMIDLVDAVELQGWTHLFLEWPVPMLQEKEINFFIAIYG